MKTELFAKEFICILLKNTERTAYFMNLFEEKKGSHSKNV